MHHSPICPYCEGPIVDHTEGDPGEMMMYYRCAGACQRFFYPPWYEHQWTAEPDSRPLPAELVSRYVVNEATNNQEAAPPAARPIHSVMTAYIGQYAARGVGALLGVGLVIAITYLIAYDRMPAILLTRGLI